MVGLPATGELTYNGYTFDGASQIDVQVTFVYDEAERTVIAHQHNITVNAIVANSDGLDDDLEEIRKKLGEAGRKLTFISKGFGEDLKVTPGGPVQDIDNGPNPQTLSWDPVGDDKAAAIVWKVETTVAVCDKGSARSRGIMAINYGIDYSIDIAGDTTRVLSGYIQIASNTVRGRAQDTADAYRQFFSPPVLAGFRREQRWSLNNTKSRVDFTITDTQVASANAYPAGIIDIQATHRQSWARGVNGRRFINTITATITPEAKLSGAQAWNVFLFMVQRRLNAAKRRGRSPFLTNLDVIEGIFSRTHQFSISYWFLSSIGDFLGDAGMWQSIGTGWNTWSVSLDDSMFNNRGNARLRDVPANDAVVSLCESPERIVPNNAQEFKFVASRVPPRFTSPGVRNDKPKREESYIEYESVIIPEREAPAVRQSILQSPDETGDIVDDPNWLLQPIGDEANFTFPQKSERVTDVIQVGGAGRYSVRLIGRAKRAGWRIPRPAIVRVGNQDVTEVSAWYPQRVVGNFFGVPVYEAMWDIEYLIGRSPGRIDMPIDRAEGVVPIADRTDQPTV